MEEKEMILTNTSIMGILRDLVSIGVYENVDEAIAETWIAYKRGLEQ